jgi:hypothetical protein
VLQSEVARHCGQRYQSLVAGAPIARQQRKCLYLQQQEAEERGEHSQFDLACVYQKGAEMMRMALPILVGVFVVLVVAPYAKTAARVGLSALYHPQRVQQSVLARSWHRSAGLPS